MRLGWRKRCGTVLKLPCPCQLLQTKLAGVLLFYYKTMDDSGWPPTPASYTHPHIHREPCTPQERQARTEYFGWHCVYQFWNAPLRRTGKINVYFSSTAFALALTFEFGGIWFCWLRLWLNPLCLNCWSAFPCSVLTCTISCKDSTKFLACGWHPSSISNVV